MLKERRFARHPTDVPIEVEYASGPAAGPRESHLHNVGLGGLSFHLDHALDEGAAVSVRIPICQPAFETRGRVVWCRREPDGFDVGVELSEENKVFRARMVEQICQIEHYRKEVLRTEGRELTGQDAGMEWIAKKAADFPSAE